MRYLLSIFMGGLLLTQFATAQNLQLDPSFHHDGFVVTDFGHGPDSVASIALLPDGKFLVGSTSWNGTPDILVSRFHADGSPDLSFGSRGRVFVNSNANDRLISINTLPDGKILLAGTLNYSGALIQLLPDGNFDPAFGNNGRVLTCDQFFGCFATAAAVQPDGKILIAIKYDKYSPFTTLLRYSHEGILDTLFGSGGMVGIGPARAIAFQAGGKIIVAGNTDRFSPNKREDIMVSRYTPDGQIDSSFGIAGVSQINLFEPDNQYPYYSSDYVSTVLVQPDSMIVVAGHSYHGVQIQHLFAARFFPDGSFDRMMLPVQGGLGGPPSPLIEEGLAADLQPDGKIVVAGNYYTKNANSTWEPSFFIVRFDTTGGLDKDFGAKGLKIVDLGQYDRAHAVAVLPGGEILAAGQTRRAYPYFESEDVDLESDIAMIRLDSTGTLDTLFASGGISRVAAGTNTDRATDLILQQDGKIVIGAVLDSVMPYREPAKPAAPNSGLDDYEVQNAPYFAISRYLEDGTLDTAFGANGRTGFLERELGYYGSWWLKYSNVFNDPNAPPLKAAIATRPNGNILLAGVRNQNFGVAEFYSNGKQDTSLILGSPGSPIPQPPYVLGIDFNHYYEVATAIVADDVLSPIPGLNGFTTAGYSGDETAVAWCCYLGIGAPGINRATVNIGPDKDYATAVGYQVDTALSREYTLVGGYYLDGPGKRHRSFLFRLINNIFSYDIDNSFGDAGINRYKVGTVSDQINAFAIQEDMSIVAAGAVDNKMAIFRFLPDGSLDNSFGNKGVVTFSAGLSAGDVAVQPNGRIVATGYSADKIITVQLLHNGQPDPTFGYNGVLTTSLRGKRDQGNAVAVQPDGKIVVAGASDDPYAGTDITVLRYKPNSGIPPLSASAIVTAVSCPGNSDGQATVTATGGFPPYTYKWNTGETSPTLAGLSATTYTVTITDSVLVKFVLTVDVPVMSDTAAPVIVCPANMITQACSTAVQYDLPVATDNCGADSPELISGLPPGSIFPEGITVVAYQTADAAGNTAICQFEIQVENTLVLSTDADPACPGELNQLTASASGGTPPYAYGWNNGDTGPVVMTATSGLFTVTLTDALGCARSDTVSVQSFPPMDIAGTITPAWIDSANGAITVTVGGGVPPFTYAWYQAGQQVGTGPALSNIPGGDYTLIVTDAAGCMDTTVWTVPEVVATTEPANVLQCRVFPNPFTEKLQLQLELRRGAEVRWRICDLTGRCYDEHIAGYTGYLQTELRTDDLPAGMYLLYIRIGGDMVQRRLVKVAGD